MERANWAIQMVQRNLACMIYENVSLMTGRGSYQHVDDSRVEDFGVDVEPLGGCSGVACLFALPGCKD
jgi:hypothetical protein